MALALVPLPKNSILVPMLGLPFDKVTGAAPAPFLPTNTPTRKL